MTKLLESTVFDNYFSPREEVIKGKEVIEEASPLIRAEEPHPDYLPVYSLFQQTIQSQIEKGDFSCEKIQQALENVNPERVVADIERSTTVKVDYLGCILDLKEKEDQEDLVEILIAEHERNGSKDKPAMLVSLFDQGIRGICMTALEASFRNVEDYDPESSPSSLIESHEITVRQDEKDNSIKTVFFKTKGKITEGIKRPTDTLSSKKTLGTFEHTFSCSFTGNRLVDFLVEDPILEKIEA